MQQRHQYRDTTSLQLCWESNSGGSGEGDVCNGGNAFRSSTRLRLGAKTTLLIVEALLGASFRTHSCGFEPVFASRFESAISK